MEHFSGLHYSSPLLSCYCFSLFEISLFIGSLYRGVMEGRIGGVDDYILGGREERNESNEKRVEREKWNVLGLGFRFISVG